MKVYGQQKNQPQQKVSPNIRSRAKAVEASPPVHPIMRLQQRIGNQAVQRLLRANAKGLEAGSDPSAATRSAHDFTRIPVSSEAPVRLQAKLNVSAPGDVHEQEADRVAAQVTSMPERQLQRSCACGGGCPKCQKQPAAHEHLQMKSVHANDIGRTEAPPIVHEVLRSSGQPLDRATRAFMEPRFGHDFSRVRVHTDAHAAESARAVNALAYTVGRDVVFGGGHYQPETIAGRRLLAHELTHSIQQENGFQPLPIRPHRDQHEQPPDRSALAVTHRLPSLVIGQTGANVMRQSIKQQAEKSKTGASKEGSIETESKDKVDKSLNHESILSDLKELRNLKISGSKSSVPSDAKTLSRGIRKMHAVVNRMGTFNIPKQSAQNIQSKVSELGNKLALPTIPIGLAKEGQRVSVASFTGAEPVGVMLVLEILGEIVAAIAAILEAPIVIIIAVIVLVIWLIYEIIKAIIREADRTLCALLFVRCKRRSKYPCGMCMLMCQDNEGEWPFDKCPIQGK